VTDVDLFSWWAIIISGGSIFHALVSIYLYANTKTRREKNKKTSKYAIRLLEDFVFVWVLLGLLIFYIVSIQIGSAIIFAAGNILVEAALTVYLIKNRKRESE